MVSFFRLYMSGEVGEDAIHDHIEAWHEGNSAKPLSAYLGLTDREYGAWVEDPRCLPQLVKERRMKDATQQPRPPSPRTTKRARWARCPVCDVPDVGAPISAACNGFDRHEPDGDRPPRLVCCLCGLGWHGTDEEVERSERKERAYQRQAIREGR